MSNVLTGTRGFAALSRHENASGEEPLALGVFFEADRATPPGTGRHPIGGERPLRGRVRLFVFFEGSRLGALVDTLAGSGTLRISDTTGEQISGTFELRAACSFFSFPPQEGALQVAGAFVALAEE